MSLCIKFVPIYRVMCELHHDGDWNVVCGHGSGGAVGGQVNPGFRFDGRCATGRSLASLVSGYRGLWLLLGCVAGFGGVSGESRSQV